MTIFAPNTIIADKRHHVRVPFVKSVKMSGLDIKQGCFPAKNLSLGGIYLAGSVPVSVGDDCRIELHTSGRHASVLYPICGIVVHQDGKGVGIRFTGMEERSFTFLQAMLLYGSEDPIAMAEYFIDEQIKPGEACC